MKKFVSLLVLLFAVGNLMAADRYIVVLDKQPVIKVAKRAVKTKAAKMYRQEVLEQQKDFINFVEKNLKGKTFGSIQTVLNAVFVEIDANKVEKLKEFPGVKYIQKDKIYKLELDGANRVCDNVAVYRRLGMSNLDIGKGVKIAILDTGIDISNPMFNDEGFEYPEGFNPGDDNEQDYTNNKVIVAKNFGSDQNASDQYGHGTACAGCAAGRYVEVQDGLFLYKLLGAAPGAYLGNYKVFTMGPQGPSAYQSSILNGIDAAVNDGMDIISMSLGGDISGSASDDAEVQAIENAIDAGVVCLVAAGNEGDNFEDLISKYCGNDPTCDEWRNHLDEFSLVPMSVAAPGNAPDAITVGAVDNERNYSAVRHATFYIDDEPISELSDIQYGVDTQVGANLTEFSKTEVVDLADYTTDDEACNPLDGIDLSGKAVLVKRGDCYFCQKIKHCQDAGAAAVIVYNSYPDDDPDHGGIINMDVGPSQNCPYALNIPGFFIKNSDGVALKQVLASSTSPVYFSIWVETEYQKVASGYKTWFSSTGPTKNDYFLKPDVAAPGQRIMAPTQDDNNSSDMYSATGFAETQGTSFSTPYTAGIAAAFKSLFPDLSPAEIKGVLCTATGFGYDLYQSKNGINNIFYTNGYATPAFLGGGIVNMENAVNAKLTLMPSNISFGNVDTSSVSSISKTFTVKNITNSTISFIPSLLNICANDRVNASISPTTKQTLNPGESVDITLTAHYTDPAATHLMGFVVLTDNYGNEYKLPFYGRFVSSDVLNHGDTEDEDGDGINHGTELGAWSDVYLTDTDNDGMSDADEINGIDVNGKTIHYNPANATSVYYDPFADTELTVETYVPVFNNDYDEDEFTQCTLYLSNPNSESVYLRVLPLAPDGTITTTVRKLKLEPHGWKGVKIDKGMFPVGGGWILVKSSNTVKAVMNFETLEFNRKKPGKEANYYIENSAAIAGTDRLYSKVYVPHIAEQTEQWDTFVSVANPGSASIAPKFVVPGSTPVDLGSVGKLGLYAAEDVYSDVFNENFPYSPDDKAHWWATIDGNGSQFVAMEAFSQLRFEDMSDPTPLMDQVGALLLTDDASTTVIIPHVDTHWLWWTGVVINNVNDADVNVTMTPYDSNGNALTPVTFTLAANSKAVNLVQGFWTSNNAQYPEDTAWIKITADQPITGYELFGIDPTKGSNNNGEDALAGVRPIMNPSNSIAFPYVFTQTSSEWCGIVVINANEETANLTIEAYNALGEKVGELNENLGANQKWVGVVSSDLIPGLTDDVRWIKVTSNVPVGGFALFGDLDRYYMSGYKAVDVE
ncbi:hypothetical protein TTHT_0819 [Thermotomaculum hydrothermale]|uniref:Peptidase S8 and S53 subtilisin kexin sedolisin n=1 Tax=Thermotomaculum hydrothermale TaxID=981385 RepID=A0A7R6SY47_9BACT|nr:S8 family serine peptidase [Thermotomaculum hydrothermale]BBB32384.1 hypothetical protein TTHT_0819 [Thermotomaculum hydrothermale]